MGTRQVDRFLVERRRAAATWGGLPGDRHGVGRTVALEVILHADASEIAVARFEREAVALAIAATVGDVDAPSARMRLGPAARAH